MPDIAGTADQPPGSVTPGPDATPPGPPAPEPAASDPVAREPEALDSAVDGAPADADPDARTDAADRLPSPGDAADQLPSPGDGDASAASVAEPEPGGDDTAGADDTAAGCDETADAGDAAADGDASAASAAEPEPEPGGDGETAAVADGAGVDGGTEPATPGADGPTDPGELDELTAVLDDGSDEPRRHWLRYPGLFGALTVVALVILVPCGAGILFFTGAFADPGAYGRAPDACARLTAHQVEAAFGAGLVRDYPSDTGDESSCTYLGGAASGRNARVTLTLTRYGTKGPLSAPRMAHAGFTSDLSGTRDRATLAGLGDEAARVTSDTGTTVLVRRSNLVLRLDASGDIEDPSRGVTSTARALVGSLR